MYVYYVYPVMSNVCILCISCNVKYVYVYPVMSNVCILCISCNVKCNLKCMYIMYIL